MSDMSPKELDELFQQGAEMYDFEYNPDAWQDMEARLDKDRRRRFLFWILGAGIASLVLFLSWWSFNTKEYPIMPIISVSEIAIEEDTSFHSNNENIDLILTATPFDNKLSGQSESKQNKQNISITDKNEKLVLYPSLNKKNQTKTKTVLSDRPMLIVEDEKSENMIVKEEESSFSHNAKIVPIIPILSFGNLVYSDKITYVNTIQEQKSLEQQKDLANKEGVKSKRKNTLLFGVLMALESSSAGGNNFSDINLKYGLQLEYRFRQRYGLAIGASFSNKKYNAGEGEYTPPKGFWTRTIAPQSTKARCSILEVPITASYFRNGYNNNGVFTNIGLSSYFMLKEQYDYSYDLPDPDLIRKWSTENSNRHWLGMGQFSVGYQHYITPQLPLQIAPYLQIPIAGVGHGQVKLWSVGLKLKINVKL